MKLMLIETAGGAVIHSQHETFETDSDSLTCEFNGSGLLSLFVEESRLPRLPKGRCSTSKSPKGISVLMHV